MNREFPICSLHDSAGSFLPWNLTAGCATYSPLGRPTQYVVSYWLTLFLCAGE